jgi:integrase
MQRKPMRGLDGIEIRHAKRCRSGEGAKCSCRPSYRGYQWSERDRKTLRGPWTHDLAAAKGWRDDARTAARKGALRAPTGTTIREAGEALLAGVRDGTIRTRSGHLYKPSTIRGYEQALRLHVYPELGPLRLGDVRRADLQAFVDRILAEGADPSTARNALKPLHVIYRRALVRDQVGVNPTQGLELPAIRGHRERIASPAEAEALLAALPMNHRALWATALYAGLRLGELRALGWEQVDLANGRIGVVRSWDPREGFIEPKSRAGQRVVPIAGILRDYLLEHKARVDPGLDLVFGTAPGKPFDPATINSRAKRAWKAAGLKPIGMHECRHTFASLLIAAGVNAKALSTYVGHSSVATTYDVYGHLMPGNEAEATAQLDAHLEQALDSAGQPSRGDI